MKIRLFILSFFASSFVFADDVTTLSPTVVTATKTEAKSFDLPVSIDVVGKDVLQDGKVGAVFLKFLSEYQELLLIIEIIMRKS